MTDDLLSLFPELDDFPSEATDSSPFSISFGRAGTSVTPDLMDLPDTMATGKSYYLPTDINGDGIADNYSIGIDVNSDGIIDEIYGINDTDLDGLCETKFCMIDTDSDGITDIVQQNITLDNNGDGIADAHLLIEDNNSDGIADYAQTFITSDSNGDGLIDVCESAFDTNADGIIDIIQKNTVIDSNNDGIMDAYSKSIVDTNRPDCAYLSIYSDSDGDHIWQAEQEFYIENETIYAIENAPDSSHDIYENFDPETADMSNVIGDPEKYMDNWHRQETGFSCAVAAQEFVIEELLGVDFEESELRRIAVENGWLSEAGTAPGNAGKLMEHMGLNVEISQNNTFEDLCDSLSRGIHPIVGVDLYELITGNNEELYLPGENANHALQVIGVDMNDPENPMVILNDSSCLDGCGAMIPKEVFVSSWENLDCTMIEAYL